MHERETPSAELLKAGPAVKHPLSIDVVDRGPANRRFARLAALQWMLLGVLYIARFCVVHPVHKCWLATMGLLLKGSFLGNLARFSVSLSTGGAVSRLKIAVKQFYATIQIKPLSERPWWVPARAAQWLSLFHPLTEGSTVPQRRVRRRFERWANDDPTSSEIIYYTDDDVTQADVQAGYDPVSVARGFR